MGRAQSDTAFSPQLRLHPGGGYAGVGARHGGDSGKANSCNLRPDSGGAPSLAGGRLAVAMVESISFRRPWTQHFVNRFLYRIIWPKFIRCSLYSAFFHILIL
jgi:hypothetical protein